MALTPRSRDDGNRFLHNDARLTHQEIRRVIVGPPDDKTFIGGGGTAVDVGLYIPPAFVSTDIQALNTSRRYIFGFAGVLRVGDASIDWVVGSTTVATGHDIDDDPAAPWLELATPYLVSSPGEWVQPVVTAAAGAADFAFAVIFATETQ